MFENPTIIPTPLFLSAVPQKHARLFATRNFPRYRFSNRKYIAKDYPTYKFVERKNPFRFCGPPTFSVWEATHFRRNETFSRDIPSHTTLYTYHRQKQTLSKRNVTAVGPKGNRRYLSLLVQGQATAVPYCIIYSFFERQTTHDTMGCKASKEHILFNKSNSEAVPWDTLHQLDSCDSDFDPIEYVASIQEKQNRRKRRTKWGEHKHHLDCEQDSNVGRDSHADDSSRFLLPPTVLCSEKEQGHNNHNFHTPTAFGTRKSMGTDFYRAMRRLKPKDRFGRQDCNASDNENNAHRNPFLVTIRRRNRQAPKTYGLVAAERYYFAHNTNQTFESLSSSSDSSTSTTGHSSPKHHDGVFVGFEDNQRQLKEFLL